MKMIRLVLLSLLVGCATVQAHTRVEPGFNLFSEQQDAEIGAQSAAQAERQLPMLNTPIASAYINRLGSRLAQAAPGPQFNYRFRVVNLGEVNAFALPGGFVYVNRGLIERVSSEGELASVLAHEIAHVALRHPTHQVSKAYVANAGASFLERLLGGSSSGGKVLGAVGGLGLNALFLRFSRSAESEADAIGAQIMARAGYDPMEMARFFQVLRQQAGRDPSRFATFLSDHPAPADRESHIRREAAAMSVRRASPIGNLRAVQSELRSLAPAPRQLAAR